MAEAVKAPVIMSTRTRKFTKKFEENQNITFELPLDTVLVGMIVRIFGSISYSFSAGTPFGRPEGIFESLVSRMDVQLNGRRTIKSVTPHLLNMQQIMTTGIAGERFAQAGAAPIADDYPTQEGPFVFGTTGQYTTVREALYLPFEHVYCEPGMGREDTYLNLKRANSAELRLQTVSLAQLNAGSGVTGLAFANNKLQIEVTLIERQDIDPKWVFKDWKQTFRRIPLTGQISNLPIDIPSGPRLSGIMLYTQNGNNATTSLPQGNPVSSVLGEVELKKNGQETIQTIYFKTLQTRNRQDYGLVSATTAGVNRLDGVAHLNLLSRRDLGTAFVNNRAAGVDSLQLALESQAATVVDYTRPAMVTMMIEEIVDNPEN